MKFIVSFLGFALALTAVGCRMIEPSPSALAVATDSTVDNTRRMVEEGRRTFRSDTFGSEAFWGDTSSSIARSQATSTAASAAVSARRPRLPSA